MKRLDSGPGRQATASDHLFYLPDYVEEHGRVPVVLHARVSSHDQRSHLADIVAYLRTESRGYQLRVVGVVAKVVQGWRGFANRRDLQEASRIAREHGAIILTESASRVIRAPGFHAWKRPHQLPAVNKFASLVREVGVDIVTAIHPDASREAVKVHESTVRAGFARRKPKAIREELQPIAFAMFDEQASIGEVARQLKLAKGTVQRWRERHRMLFHPSTEDETVVARGKRRSPR